MWLDNQVSRSQLKSILKYLRICKWISNSAFKNSRSVFNYSSALKGYVTEYINLDRTGNWTQNMIKGWRKFGPESILKSQLGRAPRSNQRSWIRFPVCWWFLYHTTFLLLKYLHVIFNGCYRISDLFYVWLMSKLEYFIWESYFKISDLCYVW